MDQRQGLDWNPVRIIPDPPGILVVNPPAIQYIESHPAVNSTGNLFAPRSGKRVDLVFLCTHLQTYIERKKYNLKWENHIFYVPSSFEISNR